MTKTSESFLSKEHLFIISIIISGGFITILNQTVLAPALPSIMRDFQITASEGQWLTTIFLLVNGIMVPVTAYLIDKFSTRVLFLVSMGIFTLGTAIAAFAPNFSILLLARICQALGAGIQMPLGSVVMMLLFPKEKRGYAMGLVGIVVAFAPAVGPTLSGFMVDAFGWHSIFLVLVPLAVADMIFACFFLKNIGETRNPSLDWSSVFLSTIAFGGLLFGFSAAGSYGWNSPSTIAALIIGSIVCYFYIKRQLALKEPLLNLRVMETPIFTYSVILGMILNAALIAGGVIFPIFLQNILGYPAIWSGLLMMPNAIILGIMSPISGRLFDQFGPRKLVLIGLSIMAVTTIRFCLLSENATFMDLCIIFTIRGFGMSLLNMPINTWGLNALDNSVIAHGNAVGNTARQIAGSIGTAIMVTIMTLVAAATATSGVAHSTVLGINAAFLFSEILTIFALILAFFKVHDDAAAIARRQQNTKQKN